MDDEDIHENPVKLLPKRFADPDLFEPANVVGESRYFLTKENVNNYLKGGSPILVNDFYVTDPLQRLLTHPLVT